LVESAEMEHHTARRFVVSGRVQGVGFRAFAQHAARLLGVTGWARNLDDGDVEVHANGTSSQLDDFEARLRQGPRWGEVRSVTAVEVEVSDATAFHIR
jgi:acylphosphatase